VGDGGAGRRRGDRGPREYEDLRRQEELIYLNGTTLEYDSALMGKGLHFINPNAKASCGCGSSFTV
jgi:iron-sulfur cluster assembly protein